MAEHGFCWGGEELPFRFTGGFSWLDGEERLRVTFRTTPVNAEEKQPHMQNPWPCSLLPAGSRREMGGTDGEGRGACRSARCCSLLVAGEAAQHLPPARLKSENYSCSIKADYHPSKPNSIIISMLLLYFCNWKAIIRLPPSLPPSRSLFLIHLQVMLL